MNKGLYSSKTDEWETPSALFRELDNEFHFDLDPCANEDNHKCDHYFTKEDDGILQNWGGCQVFCNPPYGRQIGRWVEKAFTEKDKPNTTIVMLLPARTDTKWFHDYIYGKAEIRFIKGRVRFGEGLDNAPFPSMIVIYKEDKSGNKDGYRNP